MNTYLEPKDSIYKTLVYLGAVLLVAGVHFVIDVHAKYSDASLNYSAKSERDSHRQIAIQSELYSLQDADYHFQAIYSNLYNVGLAYTAARLAGEPPRYDDETGAYEVPTLTEKVAAEFEKLEQQQLRNVDFVSLFDPSDFGAIGRLGFELRKHKDWVNECTAQPPFLPDAASREFWDHGVRTGRQVSERLDNAILMLADYQELRAETAASEEAKQATADQYRFAYFAASFTTLVGLTMMLGGLWTWYQRRQRPEDILLASRAEQPNAPTV